MAKSLFALVFSTNKPWRAVIGKGLILLLYLYLVPGTALAQSDKMLPPAILYPGEKPGHILVVDKTTQKLHLYRHDGQGNVTLDRIITCSTGKKLGDKIIEGDKKTPNGFYIFNKKSLDQELAPIYGILAYPTDYPNFWDKQLGRGGYGIWLHGIGKPMVDYDSNGCIELENAEAVKLESIIKLYDTPLLTYESLTMAPAADLAKEGANLRQFIESWRLAWVNKDHKAYQSKYAPEFVNSDGRSFDGWMQHKVNVAKRYKLIEVGINDLKIFVHRDVIVALFEED